MGRIPSTGFKPVFMVPLSAFCCQRISFSGIVKQSKWGTKKDHERILAFRIPLSVFVQSLSIAVPSTFQKSESYPSESQWKEAYERSETFFEWYGEIEIHGQAVKRKSIRLGLKAKYVVVFSCTYI